MTTLRTRLYGHTLENGGEHWIELQKPLLVNRLTAQLGGLDQEGLEGPAWEAVCAGGVILHVVPLSDEVLPRAISLGIRQLLEVNYVRDCDEDTGEEIEDAEPIRVNGCRLASPLLFPAGRVNLVLEGQLPGDAELTLVLAGVEPDSPAPWKAADHYRVTATLLRFESPEPVAPGAAATLEAMVVPAEGEPYPSRQVTLRPLAFESLPADAAQWALTSLVVGDAEQLVIAGPVPLPVFDPGGMDMGLTLEVQPVGTRTTLTVINLGETPRPFACSMTARVAEPKAR